MSAPLLNTLAISLFQWQDYLLYAIPMLDFEPEFNVGLWTQFSLIKGSNLILELEPDDPIGQFNNMFWTSANDSISLSKKLTCWVLKGPTGQSSPGKATESRGVGVGVGGIIIYCFRFNMNHVIHPPIPHHERRHPKKTTSPPKIDYILRFNYWNLIFRTNDDNLRQKKNFKKEF